MKSSRIAILALSGLISGSTLMAAAPNTPEDEPPLASTMDIQQEAFNRVYDIKGEYFNLKDAKVDIDFFVNPDGDVAIESLVGTSRLAALAAARELMAEKLIVTPEHQNIRHSISVRYVAKP